MSKGSLTRHTFLALSCIAAAFGPDARAEVAPAAEPLRVAAASDLRYALDEILIAFRSENPDVTIDAVYGSSGNLFAQIRQDAPFDVFLSADTEYTRRLAGEGLGEAPFPYAVGRLALVVRKDTGLDPNGLGDLLKSVAIRRIAIANPAHAPYGRAAEAALRSFKVYDAVASKLVLGDSVAQAAQFMDTGVAQAGLVGLSLARAKAKDLAFVVVSADAHPPIEQAGIVLKRSKHLKEARTFQAFLRGDIARTIFDRHGFSLPQR